MLYARIYLKISLNIKLLYLVRHLSPTAMMCVTPQLSILQHSYRQQERRLNIDQHLDLDTVLEAIEALGDGIAIYDANARPLYANAVTLKRFGRMYADMEPA